MVRRHECSQHGHRRVPGGRRGRLPVDELAKAVQSSGLNEAYYSNGHLLRPLFLSRAGRERLDADLNCLHEMLIGLPARLFDGDVAAFAAAVGAVGPQIEAARAAAGQTTRLSRADLYTDAGGFKLLELNVSGAVGGLENAQLNRAYLASPQFSAFAAEHELDHVDTMAALADTLREETGSTGGRPVVAIVDSPDSFPMLRASSSRTPAALGRLDIDAFACHLGQVECRNRRVYAAGRPVDVIYRLFLVEELLQAGDAAVDFAGTGCGRARRRGDVHPDRFRALRQQGGAGATVRRAAP